MSVKSPELFGLWRTVLRACPPLRDLPEVDQAERYIITRSPTFRSEVRQVLETGAIEFDAVVDDEMHWREMVWGLDEYLHARPSEAQPPAAWPLLRAAALHCCIAAALDRVDYSFTDIALSAAVWAGVTECPQVLSVLLVAVPASQLLLDRNDEPSCREPLPFPMHLPPTLLNIPPEPAPTPITAYLASVLVAKAIRHPGMAEDALAGALGIVDEDPLLTPVRGLLESIRAACVAWG